MGRKFPRIASPSSEILMEFLESTLFFWSLCAPRSGGLSMSTGRRGVHTYTFLLGHAEQKELLPDLYQQPQRERYQVMKCAKMFEYQMPTSLDMGKNLYELYKYSKMWHDQHLWPQGPSSKRLIFHGQDSSLSVASAICGTDMFSHI